MTDYIYHITSHASWAAAQSSGIYKADSLMKEGFIHCSKAGQILRVANNYYLDQPGLVILMIDPAMLKAGLRWEPGSDKVDELFPHIHSPLNLDAVARVFDFLPGRDGKFHLPPDIGMISN